MTKKIVTLAGDGIGPEIMSAGLRVLKAVSKKIAFE
ncbi:3-isopropylmalate dehydrogenase, partial [Streptococcus thermophilus]|nr:3-isopropylmalate dehydrogenase [Streptococcus thermophilus]